MPRDLYIVELVYTKTHRRMPGLLPGFSLVCLGLLLSQQPVHASNQDLHIQEIMAGANGNSRIQFIVVEQGKNGENLWGPQGAESQSRAMLVFFDALGRETGKFKFPADPPAGGTLKTLIATQEFASLPGAPEPDILIPPLLNALSGKVCFKDNPSNASAARKNECVSYGNFQGDTEINRSGPDGPGTSAGQPAPSLPILNAVSLRRSGNLGQNSDFTLTTSPSPANHAGATLSIPVATRVEQGETLFKNETFSGNGRTCASCHVEADGFALTPRNVQSRFTALALPQPVFDPLFVGESAPSAFDAGFDFNLNTLVLTAEVETPAPCTGELRGEITSENGARAKVLARVSPVSYLVYGGLNPRLAGMVTDGICFANAGNITAGDLAAPAGSPVAGIDDPLRMRSQRDPGFPQTLILENIDGFSNPPVFRKSTHLLNLSQTAPYGLSGDIPDLQAFTNGAVAQHFPRTLARNSGSNPDFRLPTPDELAALEAFMLAQEFPAGGDPNKFDLARFATTESQRRGREEFVGFGCASCHGGPTLSQTTVSIQGKPVGVNASFNTGSPNSPLRAALPCEPAAETVGACGTREFSTPQLWNLPLLGPFFHDGSARTLAEAVNFYSSSQFSTSPANVALINQGIGVVPTDAIVSFLEGLVTRPYALTGGALRFGSQEPASGPTADEDLTVTNTGSSTLSFDSAACRLTGRDPGQFSITSCPLAPTLEPGERRTIRVFFDPDSNNLKAAILEIRPLNAAPSGVDVFGVGGPLGPPPSVSSISAVSGSTKGGAPITLSGTNFVEGAAVLVGGVDAGYVTVVSSTTLQVRTGAHPPGTVQIVVINPDGQTTTFENAYTFTEPF